MMGNDKESRRRQNDTPHQHEHSGKRRSSTEKKPSSSSRNDNDEGGKKKKEGKPRRRISFDDMDIEKLKRRSSTDKKEDADKNRSKCDLNLKNKERSSRRSSGEEKTKGSSSRRLTDENKRQQSSRRNSAEEKKEHPSPKIKHHSKRSAENESKDDNGRRSSTEKKRSPSPSERRRSTEKKEPSSKKDGERAERKTSMERHKKQSSRSRPNRRASIDDFDLDKVREGRKSSLERPGKHSSSRRPRRPSVDDFAVEEFKRKSRRQSNESSSSNKAKDDLDLSLSGRDGKNSSENKGGRGKQSPDDNLKKFEELKRARKTKSSRAVDHKDDGKSPKQSESKSSKRGEDKKSSTHPEKRRSLDSDSDRPKRRTLGRKQPSSSSFNAGIISRRSSRDSTDSRPGNMIQSLQVKARRSIDSGSDTPKRRTLERRQSSGKSSSFNAGTISRRSTKDSTDSRPENMSKSLGVKAYHRRQSQDKEDSRRSSVDSAHAPSMSSSDGDKVKLRSRPPLLRRSSDSARFAKQDSKSSKRPSLDETTKKASTSIQRSSNESGGIPKSLDQDKLEKLDDYVSLGSRDRSEQDHDDNAPNRKSHRRHTEKIQGSPGNNNNNSGRSPVEDKAESGRKTSRRNTENMSSRRSKLSSKEMRAQSVRLKRGTHRAMRRLSNSFQGGMGMSLELDSEDDVGLSESDRHNRSDRESAKRSSSKRISHRPKLKKKSQRSSRRDTSSRQRSSEGPSQRTIGASSDLQGTGRCSSSAEESAHTEHKTEAGQPTSERDSSPQCDYRPRRKSTKSKTSSPTSETGRTESHVTDVRPKQQKKRSFWSRHKWKCLCCTTLLILTAAAIVVALILLKAFDKSITFNIGMDNEDADTVTDDTEEPLPVVVVGTNPPSVSPSIVPTERGTTGVPTPSPVKNVAIAVIVQLDGRPEETGFSLISKDNSTTYISHPIGSFAGQQDEVVMEVISIPERTELIFELVDKSGDGLCCTQGSGYYRVFAGTGDQKLKMISGEQSAIYSFVVGKKKAIQIGGVDPNEYCKPCSDDSEDCGRCAWCNAEEGFLPDQVFSWQCHSGTIKIPRQCYIGEKRVQYHNQYIAAMADCKNGFEAWPQLEVATESTICVEEASCVKTFAFTEPNCEEELSSSRMVKETCQDKIGGFPWGYSWGVHSPREQDCAESGKLATALASRCCVDGVAFCDSFFGNVKEESSTFQDMSPTKIPTTLSPTASNSPTWDGYPITILIQLDEYPQETGFSITSVVDDKIVTYLERRQGYYKTSSLVVEKVQIPEGIDAIITLTDEEGDGICCENGNGYFQVYSDQGYIILDETGVFSSSVSKSFVVGDPETLPPTVSVSPTVSTAPTFDLYPVTIAVNLDQWAEETGFAIQSVGDGHTFFEWPVGSLSGSSSSLFVETVRLPRDAEVKMEVTDGGGDGFCCLYGDGYIKIYAGESAEDESSLLAFEPADFGSDMSITFRAGPAPSRAPATTPGPTVYNPSAASIGPTSSFPPTFDAILVSVVLQLDKFSAETSWFIDSSDGLINYVERPAGYYEEMKSQKIVETVRLPKGLEYQFRIVDFMGDGTCCWAGSGWYSLYEGEDIDDASTQVFYGNGDFGREKVRTFVAGKPKTPAPTNSRAPTPTPSGMPSMMPSHSFKPSVTSYSIEVMMKLDGYSSQTGWNIAKGGNVIIDRPPPYFRGNNTLSVFETVKLEAGEYVFTALDSNGDGLCCQHGVGFYSVYSNGQLLLFRQGTFEYSYSETFSVGPVAVPEVAAALSFTMNVDDSVTISKSAKMLRGSGSSPYEVKRQRKHEDRDT